MATWKVTVNKTGVARIITASIINTLLEQDGFNVLSTSVDGGPFTVGHVQIFQMDLFFLRYTEGYR